MHEKYEVPDDSVSYSKSVRNLLHYWHPGKHGHGMSRYIGSTVLKNDEVSLVMRHLFPSFDITICNAHF